MIRSMFNARAVLTLLLGGAYVGTLIWAMLHGKLDAQSFIAGIGPSFGAALAWWFRDADGGA